MILKDIKDSIAIDMKEVKLAKNISMNTILKYTLIRLIGIGTFLLGLFGILFILHLYGVSISIGK